MRIAIVSRIFEPESGAASFRLGALARALSDAGHEVTVLTVRPRAWTNDRDSNRPYRVARFPVLRDASGYVRGYVQYMSFDIPLFFRVLFGRRYDALVVEPPPTTGFVARIAAKLRRTPYFYYGADIWSDAAEATGASGAVLSVVRRLERFALQGARGVLSVNDGVSARIEQIAEGSVICTVGNGVDTEIFTETGLKNGSGRFFVYTGTTSEWQGADIFIRAIAALDAEDVRLVFIGQGSAWAGLKKLAAELGAPVDFVDSVPPAEAAAWIRGAEASLASIVPGLGYDFAFPTKLHASWAVGTRTLFAGDEGPARTVLQEHPSLGFGVRYELDPVVGAMGQLLAQEDTSEHTAERSAWAKRHVSLHAVAGRVVDFIEERVRTRS